ncbi:MAG: SMI1/KNR4 family protein [Anaerobutyricum hallii]|jgi:SMI1/KNR4 family protein|uniref:SMI1/KNR4 family protein n=1 Tax=Anaerobutyricum hallii TaxID=39488 RepID=A0A415GA76_9FIRM|nr:SMI1/KNR4 family protein [Anaerobutyricum hallii]RHK41276.1 SMI1/KNR4 family protein [Anaerobutyricum hallii]
MNKRRWIGCKKLTKADILKVEDCIKTRLPEDYRNQIIKINNGALQRAYYSTKDIGEIAYSRNMDLSKNATTNAVELYKILDGGSKSYFPFGSVGNGDYMCFDLKKNNRVVLYINEIQKVYYLCDTFTQFIDGLTEG